MKKTMTSCDVCGLPDGASAKQLQVIFTTETTEGRSCVPYLNLLMIDICLDCQNKILKGRYLFGAGAQGHNRYWFGGKVLELIEAVKKIIDTEHRCPELEFRQPCLICDAKRAVEYYLR